jgi:hypothetical protein
VTIYVVPKGEDDLPTVGVQMSRQPGGGSEDVVWIGMPVPASDEPEDDST